MDVQFHVRVFAGKAAQHRRQPVQANMVAGADAQGAGHRAGEIADRPAHVFQVEQHLAGAGQQRFARLGEADAPAHPVEQAGAELLLQLGDAFAHRRLSEKQPFRRGGEGAALRHRQEGGQGLGVHGWRLREFR